MSNLTNQDRFIFLDGHAVIYRAYHAFGNLTDSKGNSTGATYGFFRILLKAIHDFNPKYIAVAFDHREGKSTRVADYNKYKAHRPEMPDDLKPQIKIIKSIVESFNIPQFELTGFEADDILGTVARKLALEESGVLTTIITGDKDLLQLVDDDKTHVFIPGLGRFSKDKEYDEAEVKIKMGVTPEQIPDLKSLMGDPSDNIPGVKGVGLKIATKLIQEFETLEGVYDVVENLNPNLSKEKPSSKTESLLSASSTSPTSPTLTPSIQKKLLQDKEMAFLSKKLAMIIDSAPIDFELKACITQDYDKSKVSALFEELNFKSLLKILPKDKFEETVQQALF